MDSFVDHDGPYDYTVEMRNRFKGLYLIECMNNYGRRFRTLYRRQGSRPSPWKRKAKKQMAVWGGLTIAVKRREVKSKGEKERYKHLNAEFQRTVRRDKKANGTPLQYSCLENPMDGGAW